MRVLVTGSTGKLGSALLKQLKGKNYQVKITSRKKPEGIDGFTWIYSDLLSGDGIEDAVQDVEVVIHAATSPIKNSKNIEITGFENFLSKLRHINHFIYPSIVGIEEIPYKYYKLKFEAEQLLMNSSIPHTITRATQFHSFVESLLISRPILKRYVIPGSLKFQSVDVDEYASHIIELIEKGPQGKVDDFCGPEIMTLKEMAELKIKINNETNGVLNISVPGKLFRSLVEGKNTNSKRKIGKVTFEEYLRNRLA
ncbi:SDR family oxidoreductase [Lysinibacillus sp. SGAir0095]|uniref:SDR family oxidoreductase n=1 Tax=Lysinibacillus sp. SGAir0095 TaxID=2070463 RepID=UPI0010CCDC52|nr:SDR family oxidoreductase [Lysinibacillus sp. SGAir0095]QCR32231.1 nmra-like family protein [Lysinibacillus sp. SGAir0095]